MFSDHKIKKLKQSLKVATFPGQPPAFVVRTRDLESQNFIEISKFLLRFQDFISRFQDFQKLGVGLGT